MNKEKNKKLHEALTYLVTEIVANDRVIKKFIEKISFLFEEEKWDPQIGETVWFIDALGTLFSKPWNNDYQDKEQQSFLGVYRTRKEAEQAVKDIREKLNK